MEQGICLVHLAVLVQDEPVKVDVDVSQQQSNNNKTGNYPFRPPILTLVDGADQFPPKSTIRNGDRLNLSDLDWTPSLHLADAILHACLLIKESLLQQEPFHGVTPKNDKPNRLANLKGNLTKAFSPSPLKKTPKRTPSTPKSPSQVRMGDEIDLEQEPWIQAKGIYSCKAIRRPQFVEQAMAQAAFHDEQQTFSSPTAMFRSLAQSARSVMEESLLMITQTHILELRANKLSTHAKVTLAIPIDLLAKLKFRRHESVSLFFKPSPPDDPLVYLCPDSSDVVHQIQGVLKGYGVKGRHTNAAAHQAIAKALQLVQEIQTQELALPHDPTVQRVNDIMDLYRQAAERFEVAGDVRHEEVVSHMRKFLALPLTTSVLDGSYVPTSTPIKAKSPEGEVLERTDALVNANDDDEQSEEEREKDKAFAENIDNLLKEAAKDVAELRSSTPETSVADEDLEDSGLADVAADLDAMMREADKELQELMQS